MAHPGHMLSQRRFRGLCEHFRLRGHVLSTFQYDATTIPQVEEWLSRDRLAKYLAETGDDLGAALDLHAHNTALSAAFFGPIQVFEIALRNTLDRELCKCFGQAWYDAAPFSINQDINDLVQKAKDGLISRKKAVDKPHIVAELNFGFWTLLTASRYEHSIWTPALGKAFPNYTASTGKGIKRGTVSGQLNYLRSFRNRIAHHEPIFHRDLRADYATLLGVASWLHADLSDWIAFHSRVPYLLPKRELY